MKKEAIKNKDKVLMKRESVKNKAKVLMNILFRVKVYNEDNVPKEGKAIICSNHIHAFDGPLILAFTERQVNLIAKKELWKKKLLVPLLELFNVISIDRQNPKSDLGTFRKIRKVLNDEELLGIFPEGTRLGIAKGDEVKKGAAAFAIKNDAPIVPVKLVGKYNIFSGIKIIYGKPFKLVGCNANSEKKLIMQAIDNIETPIVYSYKKSERS